MERAQIKSILLLMGAFATYKLSILLAWNGDALTNEPWGALQPRGFVVLFFAWGIASALTLLTLLLGTHKTKLSWKNLKRLLSSAFAVGLVAVIAFIALISSSNSLPALIVCAIVMSVAYACMHFVWIIFALKTKTILLLGALTVGQLATSLSFMLVKQLDAQAQTGCLVAVCAILFITTFSLIMQDEHSKQPASLFPPTGSSPLFNPLVAGIAISTLGVGILWGSSPFVRDYKLWVFGAIAVCSVFLVVSLVRKRAVDPETLIQIVFAILGLAILFATIAPEWHAAFMGIVWIGYSTLSICLFLLGKKQGNEVVDGHLLVAALAIFDSNIALGLGLGHVMDAVAPWVETPTTVAVALLLAFIFLFGNRRRLSIKEKQGEIPAMPTEAEGIDEAIRSRCTVFAAHHRLTEAETDTLFYLTKGHSIDRIAQDRFVSRNTIKSQMTSVYRKVGIHSKQELLRLLEEEKLPNPKPPA
ncbi:MAG: LuxR C-terminal-related transcriptional regulator [Gordonibacter sp.]